MSLLNRGTETVKVFQEVQTPETDSDGNMFTRAARIGTLVRAVVQPISSTENADGGFNTVSRLPAPVDQLPEHSWRSVSWRGKRYAVDGDPLIFNGFRRTAHVDYVSVRG